MKSIHVEVNGTSYQIHSNTQDLGGVFVQPGIEGVGVPEIRHSAYNRAGEDGAIVSNVFYGGRLITLPGKVFGSTIAAYEQKRRWLQQIMALRRNAMGVAQPVTLRFVTLDDLQVQIEGFLRDFQFNPDHVLSSKFFLQFYCPDYVFEAQALESVAVARYGGGGVIIPVIFPMTFTVGEGSTSSVTNDGTAEAYPIITLNGLLTNPRLTNTTTGESILLEMTISSSDQVVIDMKERTIIQNGNTSKISEKSTDSTWWKLATGVNNLQLTTSESGDTGNAVVEFRDSYMGI